MSVDSINPDTQHPPHHSAAYQKLRFTIWGLRFTTVLYAMWTLRAILMGWVSIVHSTHYLGKDISGMATWQWVCAMGLNLLSWGLLCGAIAYAWICFNHVSRTKMFSKEGAQAFRHCAWWAIACEISSIATRPLVNYLISFHLPPAERMFIGSFASFDILAIIFCLALLTAASMYSWAQEIAEENKAFV